MSERGEVITLGGGCFWCLEAVFLRLYGVKSVQSGYMGGHTQSPSYHQVCQGETGHAEVVQICFDPAVRSLEQILMVFFALHDPTTLNRQGNDVGTQYRSVIFVHQATQEPVARQVMAELEAQRLWPEPFVTEIALASEFYPAEDYHQNYFELNGQQGYCQFVVAPKVAKFRQYFRDWLKP